MRRPHLLYLFYDTKKWLFLLLLPVLRGLLSQQDTLSVILSSLRDIALASLLILYSLYKWRGARYSLHGGLTLKQGILYQRTLRVMADDAASVEVERTPLMWLTGGRRVRINTAGLRRRADATIYLPVSVAKACESTGNTRCCRYAARVFPVLIMAASHSNAALGFLTLAPALRQAGQILGREFSGEVYGLMSRVISLGLPPLLDAAANVLVLGWCFAFVRTFSRTAGFFAEREGPQLHLLSGLITRRDTYIDSRHITTLELRQTLFMRLFELQTVTITAAGYGREQGARPLIIPAAHPRELCGALDSLLPDYPTCKRELCPSPQALWRYGWPPLFFTLCGLFPLLLGGVWNVLSLIWIVAGAWWLSVRVSGYSRAGFGVSDRAVTLRYSRGLALYEVHVPREVADCAVITRSPWQRRSGTCTVELRCFGEKRRRHRVLCLPYEQTKALAEKLVHPSY